MSIRSIFSIFIVLLLSCTEREIDSYPSSKELSLKDIHMKVKNMYSSTKNTMESAKVDNVFTEKFVKTFDDNYHYMQDNGVEALLERNGINSNVIFLSNYYYAIQNEDNAYDLLYNEAKKMGFNDSSDFLTLFNYIELKKEIINQLSVYNTNLNKFEGISTMRVSRDCTEAIVGTVITTIGAIGVGGPAGLGIWLVAKGYSTYQLVRACA